MAEPELKEFDGAALGECDGSGSKPACVAVDGSVYDVSGSKLWKGGQHMKRHRAGRDLSGDIAAAPHGKEVLERVPCVGTMKKEAAVEQPMPAWLAGLLEKIPFLRRHPHPMVVHFPIVFMYSAAFFNVLYMITGEKSFEMTAFYCLAGGILFTPPAMITGWFTWWLNYMAKPMGPVTIKNMALLAAAGGLDCGLRLAPLRAGHHGGDRRRPHDLHHPCSVGCPDREHHRVFRGGVDFPDRESQ